MLSVTKNASTCSRPGTRPGHRRSPAAEDSWTSTCSAPQLRGRVPGRYADEPSLRNGRALARARTRFAGRSGRGAAQIRSNCSASRHIVSAPSPGRRAPAAFMSPAATSTSSQFKTSPARPPHTTVRRFDVFLRFRTSSGPASSTSHLQVRDAPGFKTALSPTSSAPRSWTTEGTCGPRLRSSCRR